MADQIVRGIAADGYVKVVGITTTGIVTSPHSAKGAFVERLRLFRNHSKNSTHDYSGFTFLGCIRL